MEMRSNLKKVYTKLPAGKRQSDFAFWQTQSYETRLETLEQIRQEYHSWKQDTEPGLQRVYKIVKR